MKNLIMVGYFIIIIFFAYAVILIKDLKNTDVT
jgi:drug/metabolite transporter (DMT)-like permease